MDRLRLAINIFVESAIDEPGSYSEQQAEFLLFGLGACRGTSPTDNPKDWYTTVAGFNGSSVDCEALCINTPGCIAIEYDRAGRYHCELWTKMPEATSGNTQYKCAKRQASLMCDAGDRGKGGTCRCQGAPGWNASWAKPWCWEGKCYSGVSDERCIGNTKSYKNLGDGTWCHFERRDTECSTERPTYPHASNSSACPEPGVFAHNRCWYLSEVGNTCDKTCDSHGLGFSMSVAPFWSPMVPWLVNPPKYQAPTTKQKPWARLECYVENEDRYHTASWFSKASVYGDVGDPKDFNFTTCRLACPCTKSQEIRQSWRFIGNGYCQPYGVDLGRADDWLGRQGCQEACDANPRCNRITYDTASGQCYMSRRKKIPSPDSCDQNINGWSYWKPIQMTFNEKKLWREAQKAFHNRHELPDGSAVYGMLFHKTAPAIHEFGSCSESEKINISGATEKHIVIRDVRIKQLRVRTDNIVMVNSADGIGVRGPAGDVVQLLRESSCDEECETLKGVHYEGSVLSDAQLALQVLKNAAQAQFSMQADDLFKYFGGISIPEAVLKWAGEWKGSLQNLFCSSRRQCAEALQFDAENRGITVARLLKRKYYGKTLADAAHDL